MRALARHHRTSCNSSWRSTGWRPPARRATICRSHAALRAHYFGLAGRFPRREGSSFSMPLLVISSLSPTTAPQRFCAEMPYVRSRSASSGTSARAGARHRSRFAAFQVIHIRSILLAPRCGGCRGLNVFLQTSVDLVTSVPSRACTARVLVRYHDSVNRLSVPARSGRGRGHEQAAFQQRMRISIIRVAPAGSRSVAVLLGDVRHRRSLPRPRVPASSLLLNLLRPGAHSLAMSRASRRSA